MANKAFAAISIETKFEKFHINGAFFLISSSKLAVLIDISLFIIYPLVERFFQNSFNFVIYQTLI